MACFPPCQALTPHTAPHTHAQVLILDFDLHHGNGTADIFADDPSVLFIDTHEASSTYPPPFAPGDAEDMGEGPGRGATINVPLPREPLRDAVLCGAVLFCMGRKCRRLL